MTRAVEKQPSLTPMQVARTTVELFRVVPVERLEVVTTLIREGKRVQTTEVRLYAGDLELAHGLVQRLRVTDLGQDFEDPPMPRLPNMDNVEDFGTVMQFRDDGLPVFGRHAVKVDHVEGHFSEVGKKTAWFRVSSELVAGEPLTPTESAIILGDFSNGLTRKRQPYEVVFMNTDLTVRFSRQPVGEWIAIDGESLWNRTGRGSSFTRLYDIEGAFGHAAQTLFLNDTLPGT
jgi:hypothetical protein